MMKKVLACFLVLVMVLSLTACGGSQTQSSQAPVNDKYPSKPITCIVPFTAGGGTDVIPSFYGHPYYETIADLTLAIPDSLVFLDGIDPDSGEMLDEPAEHTAAEFAAMLAEGSLPGFDEDNVYVTFGDGEMIRVERFYTPWQ